VQKNIQKIIAVALISVISTLIVIPAIVYPEIGERILYGKKGLEKKQHLEYSEIIISGNYDCMESAAILADGNLSRFVEKFNQCNNKS